ncbi:NAD(P)-binding protein [Gonapodya prolifera JEL478]|uniref:NAD(P)-binding protein n=1 Tax=Gonapodya prolifera (strain JEL478) TaxID=1344416 RepID=A0A139A6M6_GONPJ|nr:NAD(P)-binding protein [Gonapodya prolifera JEL478]|eukprot:KXS12105.1 NAD(P)-binding protein [Gonapodya prolifera JEL478]
MSLKNRVVLVLGASGNIGAGAVRAFLLSGSHVIAPTRTPEGTTKLVDFLARTQAIYEPDHLIPVVTDVGTPKGAEAVAKIVEERFEGKLDHVVSSSGPWWQAPNFDAIDYSLYRKAMDANYETHFVVYNAVAKYLLKRDSNPSYTVVTGMAADNLGTGITGLSQLFLRSLTQHLIFQTASTPLRVNELRIGVRVDMDQPGVEPSQEWQMKSSEFGRVFERIAMGSVKGEVVEAVKVEQVRALVDGRTKL